MIFTSDNGPWMQGNPGYLRGRKLLCFEGGFRVPFIASWPGVIPPGTTNPEMGMNFDLFVTCLQLAGVPLPQDRIIDGKDILPVLKGKPLRRTIPSFIMTPARWWPSGTSIGNISAVTGPIMPPIGPYSRVRSSSTWIRIRTNPTA